MASDLLPSAAPSIVTSGLPDDLESWLEERLDPVDLHGSETPDEALAVLRQGQGALLIINHTLSGPNAIDLLARVRADPSLADIPVLYLLDRTLDSDVGRKLLEQMGVRQLLLSPVDREQVAVAVNEALGLEAEHEEPDSDHEHVRLLIVEADAAIARSIEAEAATRGLKAEIVPNPTAARRAIVQHRPDVVLLHLDAAGDSLDLLRDLDGFVPKIPVLVLTASDTFPDRVQVAAAGGRGFLHTSLPPSEVIDAVGRQLQQLRTTESRVLAVDDDPATLAALRDLLVPEGIHLLTLDDPLRFWDTLEQAAPDLLILDLGMARLSGIELCRVVRNDARWNTLPVVFLTSNSDAVTIEEVFGAGADDYVVKPLVGPELVTKIVHRLERTLLYRSMAEIDPVTGVANRRKASHTLRQFLRLADRHRQPLSIALLDIDRFKQINDRYGHAAGDAVLQQLGALLLRTFRSEDIVARWGGEEFLIGMYGMTRADGVQRLNALLHAVRDEAITGPNGEPIHITFSAGVAQFRLDGYDLQSLSRAADDALYLAKENGRNRVEAVGGEVEPAGRQDAIDLLLVSPEEVQAPLLCQTLESRGYRCRRLTSGDEASRLLAGLESWQRPAVIILDLDLPGTDSVTWLRRLQQEGVVEGSRMLVLASPGRDSQVNRARALGIFDVVYRPFTVPVLLQRARRALEVL